ncbi:MAG: hypothetical protein HQ521_11355 [Bacteroidetes bacterium]|nr:hypothetical protein [Bacteroidota bacterium]
MKAVIYLLLFCFGIFSCNTQNSKQWEEVTSIGTIKQGTLFQLIPLKDTVLILPGDEFSKINIIFNCVSLEDAAGIKYKSAMSLPSFSGDISSFETLMSDTFETWPVDKKSQSVKIPIRILPLNKKYKGKSQVYLYIVDSTGNCISNIIAWKIKFE